MLVHQCTSTMRLVVCLLVLVLAVHSTLAISEVEVGDTATILHQGRVRGEGPLQDRSLQLSILENTPKIHIVLIQYL